MAATLPAVFAKSSMLWSSLFVLATNKNIKRKIKGTITEIEQVNQLEIFSCLIEFDFKNGFSVLCF
jgi:hypothetical protein